MRFAIALQMRQIATVEGLRHEAILLPDCVGPGRWDTCPYVGCANLGFLQPRAFLLNQPLDLRNKLCRQHVFSLLFPAGADVHLPSFGLLTALS